MGDIHRPTRVPIRSRISFIVLEKGTLHAASFTLELVRETGAVVIPAGMTTVLLLEPGVTVTHAAVKLCADQGTRLIWVGEAGVHVYSAGLQRGTAGDRILNQALQRARPRRRLAAARRIYECMFQETPPHASSIEAMRGFEGAKVRAWYAQFAADHGVDWQSRETAPQALRDALGYATSALYGVTEAVILALGYSPSIGFIHSGDPRSLVFDVADTVKFRTVVPTAFSVFAEDTADVRARVRRACRDMFRQTKLIDVLVENTQFIMGEK